MRRRAFCLVVAACLLLAGCASNRPQRYQAVYLDVFDTITVVTAYTSSEAEFVRLSEAAHKELLACHRLFDIYNGYEGLNNLYTVNEAAGKAPVAVDVRVLDLVDLALSMHAATRGRVNIAMGAVLALWHDAREAAAADPQAARLPDAAALEEAARHTDIAGVVVDREAGTLFLADPAMRVDVGAVAKGYAVQRAIEVLRSLGANSVFLSAGGNIAVIGAKPGGEKWSVGVQDPFGREEWADLLALSDYAAVTSGTYERYFTVDGARYHHIIDPDTLYPSDRWVSVTVLAQDSGLADALSTALFNMDEAEALSLIEGISGTEAFLIRPDGSTVRTGGFAAFRAEGGAS